jgi:hypothetical protein
MMGCRSEIFFDVIYFKIEGESGDSNRSEPCLAVTLLFYVIFLASKFIEYTSLDYYTDAIFCLLLVVQTCFNSIFQWCLLKTG